MLIAGMFAFLLDNLAARVIVAGLGFGGAMLAVGLLLQRLDSRNDRPARIMVMGGFLAAAVALFARALAARKGRCRC